MLHKISKKYFLLFLLIGLSFNQFGKNIVQYDDFEWKFIQTEHFDIYYYNQNKEQAEFVAYHSELAYKHLEKMLGWGLSKRSDIILYESHNDFQQTNVIQTYMEEGVGGVTELFKNRMVIPYDGSLHEFEHVLYHELVHVFINDGLYGGSVMNMLRTGNVIIPLWMNEGLAEYLSNDWGVNSDMWMRDLAINYSQMPEINQLNGYLAYRGGQSVWRFITRKWGDEVIAEIFKNIKFQGDVNKGLEKTLGVDIKELTNQWHNYLKKEYWADIENRDDIRNIARRLTDHEKLYNSYNIAPSISPDGSKVAIYSNVNGEMSIYLINSDDGKFISKIVTGQITSEIEELHILKPGISWSPNGDKIVFAAKSGDSDALFFIDINNSNKVINKKVFDLEGIFRPTWNPRNNQIAFIGNKEFTSDIYIYNLDNDSLINATNDTFSDVQVTWAPNGEELLFVSDRGDNITPNQKFDILSICDMDFHNLDIYKFTKQNQIIRLTNTIHNETYPSYSPNGETIAFISDESGINNLYLTHDEFMHYQPVTNILTGITQLNWSTNNQIIFTGFYKSGYDIFILSNLDTTKFLNKEIPLSKWKKEVKLPLKRKSIDNNYVNSKQYDNFIFSSNSSLKSVPIFTLDKDLLLDSAGTHIDYKYNTRFSLDYAQASFVYDVFEGGQGMGVFYFSDILGDHQIALQTSLQFDIDQSDVYFKYRYLKNKVNLELGLYNYAYFTDIRSGSQFQETIFDINRDFGLSFKVENPFSKFSRLEMLLSYNHLAQKEMLYDAFTGDQDYNFTKTYNILEPEIKYIWDNTRSFYLYKVSGSRVSVNYSVSPKISLNDFTYNKFEIDARNYFELSYNNKISLASRLYVGTSWGRDPRIFAIGGTPAFFHGDEDLINPIYETNIIQGTEYEFWSMNNLSFPIRGYNVGQRFGTNALLFNFELRLPFLLYYFPTVKYVGQMFGVLFVDVGVAWDNSFPSFSNKNNWNLDSNEGWIMSYGFGPRFILFGMPWKLDYAWQYNPYDGEISSDKWYLSIGVDF